MTIHFLLLNFPLRVSIRSNTKILSQVVCFSDGMILNMLNSYLTGCWKGGLVRRRIHNGSFACWTRCSALLFLQNFSWNPCGDGDILKFKIKFRAFRAFRAFQVFWAFRAFRAFELLELLDASLLSVTTSLQKTDRQTETGMQSDLQTF